MTQFFSPLTDVEVFQRQVLGLEKGAYTDCSPDFLLSRAEFIQEEVDELYTAVYAYDLVGIADALADIMYVTLGTANLLGIPFEKIWDAVHTANMSKVGSPSKRTTFDALKGADYVPPTDSIRAALECAGYVLDSDSPGHTRDMFEETSGGSDHECSG